MKRGTPDHPKTLWLMTGLGLTKRDTVGLLEMLWHWTARVAPQGDIGKWTDSQIAKGVEWEREPSELVRNLVQAGFLDEDRKYRLLVHDWAEHADGALKKQLQRQGLAFCRLADKRRTNGGQTASTRPTSEGDTRRTAVPCRAVPGQAEPSLAGPEPPRPPAALTDREARRLGEPGEIEPLRGAVAESLKQTASVTGRPSDELLAEASRTDRGKAIVRLDTCSSVPWLRVTQDRLIAIRLEHQSRNRATQRAPPPRESTPAENALYDNRAVLVDEFVAWFGKHPEAGRLGGKDLPGVAFVEWRKVREPIPDWISIAVLREACDVLDGKRKAAS